MTIARSAFVTGEVLENKAWTERLFSMTIQTEQLPFKAGQFVRLQLPVDGEVIAKSYSLVNAPDEDHMEVFFNTVPNGKLSNALASLNVGDQVEVSQPANGFFVLDEIPESKHLWMFATGTGLGPYISMLKTQEIWDRFEKVMLIQGVPTRAELAYSDMISETLKSLPEQFRFVSCVTREPHPDGLEGRYTELLEIGDLENHIGVELSPEDSHVMLCGNHHMINDMNKILGERGLEKHLRHKPGHITTEQYF